MQPNPLCNSVLPFPALPQKTIRIARINAALENNSQFADAVERYLICTALRKYIGEATL